MSPGKDIVAELDRILRLQEVLEEDDFAELIIRSTMDGIYTYDLDCRITLWNPAMERLTGVPKGDVIGQSVFERFPFLVEYGLQHQILDPLKGKICAPTVIPFDIPETGKRGFVQRHSCPLRDEHNNIVGGLSIVREVTEHRLAIEEVERLNRAEERLRILSEAGMLLTSTLDYTDVLNQVIALTTRHFDAWAKLRLLNGDGTIQVVTGHANPELEAKFRIIEEKYPPTEDLKEGPLWVLRNGGRQFYPVLTDEGHREFAKDDEHYELLRHFKSYICVPIKSHDRIFGTLSVLGTARHYNEDDLAFAEDLSRWVALAIDNARHFAKREPAAAEVTRLLVEPRRPNPTSEIWLDSSGVVRVKIMPRKIQTVENARQNFETAVEVRGGVRRPLLTDIRDAEPLEAAVRGVYCGDKVGESFSAMAILIRQSSLGSMMGNLYFRVARPGIDMRLFDNESQALDWLKTYR